MYSHSSHIVFQVMYDEDYGNYVLETVSGAVVAISVIR